MKRKYRYFILILVMIVLIAISLSGCLVPFDPVLRYSGEHVALDAAAIYSMPGVESLDSDEILILEQDAYGRTLYAICLDNDFILLDANRAFSWKVLALVVLQGQDDSHVYFYGEQNYRMTKIEGTTQLSEEVVTKEFDDETISQLKAANDWNIPTEDASRVPVKAPIQLEKGNLLNAKQDAMLEKYIGNNLRSQFLREDQNGRKLYFVVRIHNHQSFTTYTWYAVLLNADGSINGPENIRELASLQTIHEDIKDFLETQNWTDIS